MVRVNGWRYSGPVEAGEYASGVWSMLARGWWVEVWSGWWLRLLSRLELQDSIEHCEHFYMRKWNSLM